MNPDKQRIAIAEACGYTQGIGMHGLEWWTDSEGVHDEPPNYPHNLNAMHEAERVLWEMDWSFRTIFNDHLANIIKRRKVNRNEWDAETLLDSTAAQRAEALLRTIGKWEDEQ